MKLLFVVVHSSVHYLLDIGAVKAQSQVYILCSALLDMHEESFDYVILLVSKEQVKASLYEVQFCVPCVVPSQHTQDGSKVSSNESQPY